MHLGFILNRMWEHPTSLLVASFRVPTNTYTGQPAALFRVQINTRRSLLANLFRTPHDRSVYSGQSQISLILPMTGQFIPTNPRPVYSGQSQTTYQPSGPN